MKRRSFVICLVIMMAAIAVVGAQGVDEFVSAANPPGLVVGDAMPGAPALAPRGDLSVGVKTLTITNPNEIDVLSSTEEVPFPLYDRSMTVEVWYPAVLEEGQEEITAYIEHLGRSDQEGTLTPFNFVGRAVRSAETDNSQGPYPLVILSHGFPGSRYMLSYLGENLASKGYVAVAIGHTDSTYEDISAFSSTMVNRTLDQKFTIDMMLDLSGKDGFWSGLIDPDQVALVGYSMGGYGAIESLGAGCNQIVAGWMGAFAPAIMAKPEDEPDPRIKAAVLFAPWGGAVGGAPTGLFDTESLKKITAPTLWIAGSQDDIAGYSGIVNLFEATGNSDRYLLTYENALHNVAPNPAPPEAENWGQASRWADPVWSSPRMNNINQHFITAFLEKYLRGDAEAGSYLDVPVESSNDGVYAVDGDGLAKETHTYWPGFGARTAVGLQLRHLLP
jgi:predicted dienelactone hydrolase